MVMLKVWHSWSSGEHRNSRGLGAGNLSTIRSPEILVAPRNTVPSAIRRLPRRTTSLDSIPDELPMCMAAVTGNRPTTEQTPTARCASASLFRKLNWRA